MDYKFSFGFYERSYTMTETGGVPTSHTSVKQSTTITWLPKQWEFSLEIAKDNDLIAMGNIISTAINNAISPNISKFDYENPHPYAFLLNSTTEAYFTLYTYDTKTETYSLYQAKEGTLPAGSYGLLCTKVKTPQLTINYKPGLDSTGAYNNLRTETVTLDYNNSTAAFVLTPPTGQYVARTSLDVTDSSHSLANISGWKPLAPSYFFMNKYEKNPHVLDFFTDRTDSSSMYVWGPRVLYLIAALSAGSTSSIINMTCTCYETDKAPTELTVKYQNAVTGFEMGKEVIGPIYELPSPSLYAYSRPNDLSLQWDPSIKDLIPADSTFQVDSSTDSTFSNPINETGTIKYTGVCKLYPSKYTVNVKAYIDSTLVEDTTQNISLKGDAKYEILFPLYKSHTVKVEVEKDGEVVEQDKTIDVRLTLITRDGVTVSRDQVLTFKDLCIGARNTIVGEYERYLKCTIRYFGNSIYSPTDKPKCFTYRSGTSITGPYGDVYPINDFNLNTNASITCDTLNLDKTVAEALNLKVSSSGILQTADSTAQVKSTTTRIYTHNVDATINYNSTNHKAETFFVDLKVDDWYRNNLPSYFTNFKEKDTSLLTMTLRNFLNEVSTRTIDVYGDFLVAKKPNVANGNSYTDKLNIVYELRQPKASVKMNNVAQITHQELVVVYYGREFQYKELMEHIFTREKFKFTLEDSGEALANYSIYSVQGSNGKNYTTQWINYDTIPSIYTYGVIYYKQVDETEINLRNFDQLFTITSSKFGQQYADYTWVPLEGREIFSLPTDLVASSISNKIKGGKLILIAADSRPINNVYADIQLTSDKCFPTTIVSSNFTNGEGVQELVGTKKLHYNHAINLNGIMGANCTAYSTGSSVERSYNLYDLLNNINTRAHLGAPAVRSRFMIAAVGAGGGGASGDPKILGQHSAGGGGGSGGFGVWYVDLEALGKNKKVDWKGFTIKTKGGVGGSVHTGEGKDGGAGSDLFIMIEHPDLATTALQFSIYGGGGGQADDGFGNSKGGAAAKKPEVSGADASFCSTIYSAPGNGGRRGESHVWNINSADEIDWKVPDGLKENHFGYYKQFLETENNFLGVYLDKAKFGEYKTIDDFMPIHTNYAAIKMTTTYNQSKLLEILTMERKYINDLYDRPWGHSLYELFGTQYAYQRLIGGSDYSLGGTGAPSVCGFPTYWIKSDADSIDRMPGDCITGANATAYNSRPGYGAGGCGGTCTYVGFGQIGKDEVCASKGRQGGDAYWAIFC